MSEVENITLKDVETMIQILERFIRISKRAENVISRLGHMYGMRGSYSSGNFMDALISQVLERKKAMEEEEVEEVDESELDEETKRILEKIRKRESGK